MNIPFLDQIFNQVDFDRELVFKFFTVFSLFEYGLKQAGFWRYSDAVEPDWKEFIKSIETTFDPKETSVAPAVDYLLALPVKRQREVDGILVFLPQERPAEASDNYWLSVLIRGVRNNLFHGGKFPYTRPRDPELIQNSLVVLEAWSQCNEQVKSALENIH